MQLEHLSEVMLFKYLSSSRLWLALLLVVTFACLVIPHVLVLLLSLLTRDETNFASLPWTVSNYTALLDPLYITVIFDSLKLALATTLLCFLLAYPFSYALAKLQAPWRYLILVAVLITFWTNSLLRIYAIKLLLSPQGAIALIAGWFGFSFDIAYSTTAVLIGMVYLLFPFMVLPLFVAFETLDRRYLEAARDLGATRLQQLRCVLLPLTLPGITAGCLLVGLPALGLFYVADILGGAKQLLLGNLIKNQFLDARDWPLGAAMSSMLTLATVLLLWAYYRIKIRTS